MQKKFVSDLAEGDVVSDQFYVSFKRPVKKYSSGFMFELRVGDRTGEIPVKFWGGRNEMAVQIIHDAIKEGDIVLVTGAVSKYRDNLEISTNADDRQGVKRLPPEEYHLENFVAKTESDIEAMYGELLAIVRSVNEKNLKALLSLFFMDEDFSVRFKRCPAAIKYHSNVIGGLLEHTLRMVKVCERLSTIYGELDRDLLLTGALLHDIGKVDEYEVGTRIFANDPGRLMGHVFLGAEEVRRMIACQEGFPEVLAWKLIHTILSSHGEVEHGSPVTPMFPEALAISMADEMEARMDMMIRLIKNVSTDDDWAYRENVGSVYLR